jgi:hypothetical protein
VLPRRSSYQQGMAIREMLVATIPTIRPIAMNWPAITTFRSSAPNGAAEAEASPESHPHRSTAVQKAGIAGLSNDFMATYGNLAGVYVLTAKLPKPARRIESRFPPGRNCPRTSGRAEHALPTEASLQSRRTDTRSIARGRPSASPGDRIMRRARTEARRDRAVLLATLSWRARAW